MNDFLAFVKSEKARTDTALNQILDQFVDQSHQIDDEYSQFASDIKTLVLRGGKRLRSLLVRLSHDLVTEEQPAFDLVRISAYVELMHLFILIHDDIADRDLTRYGGPTLEVEFARQFKKRFNKVNPHFGQSMAMIAGDLLHVLANSVLASAELEAQPKVLVERQMQLNLHQVIAGWHIHHWQNYVPLVKATSDRYLKGMELVSASYTVQGPLEIGLILADQTETPNAQLNQYGYHTGMAFQIQDDILGVFGDTQVTGKPAGNDLREGKKTLLVLKAYELADPKTRKTLEALLGTDLSEVEVDQLKTIITQTGSLSYSQQEAQKHITEAIKILDGMESVQPEPLHRLKQMAEFVLERKY